jgi:zinc finger MIZ domain-containing protein
VDSFLLGVRRKLEEDLRLHAKRMTVAADGTWNAVVEADTEDDSDYNDGPRTKGGLQSNSAGPSAKNAAAAPVEVIILDDD